LKNTQTPFMMNELRMWTWNWKNEENLNTNSYRLRNGILYSQLWTARLSRRKVVISNYGKISRS
jgi:hypothetical protein